MNSTVTANHAGKGDTGQDGGNGGGIAPGGSNYTVFLHNSIVAGNFVGEAGDGGSPGQGPDFAHDFQTTLTGVNLIGDNTLANGSPSANFPAGPTVGTGAAPLDPLLGPLADNGGPTLTMLPRLGSPAVDPAGGATASEFPTDQRGPGFDRIVGDSQDIGATELGPAPVVTVTTLADDKDAPPDGSLRKAIADALARTIITFDLPSGDPTIVLDGEQLVIDASALPDGLTISGNDASRVFLIGSSGNVTMRSLSIVNGRAPDGGDGGGISNFGSLNLEQCTLANNRAGFGGDGGGGGFGGFGGDGAGIFAKGPFATTPVTITDCLIAGNEVGLAGPGGSDGQGPDINRDEGVTAMEINLIGDNTLANGSASTVFPAGPTVGTGGAPLDPLLGDLADNGGPTQTMLPLRGSPALNPVGGATESAFLTDQDGFERIVAGIMDIGAVEAPDYAAIDAQLAAEAAAQAQAAARAAQLADLSKKLKKLKKKAKNA